MLTIQQIAYRDAQKYNSVPRSERDDRIKDILNDRGFVTSIFDEIKINIGECTPDSEREYVRYYNQFCEK